MLTIHRYHRSVCLSRATASPPWRWVDASFCRLQQGPKSSIGELGSFVVDCGSGALWRIPSRHQRSQPMDGTTTDLKAKLDQLLREAAEVSVALDRVEGTIVGVPHYSVIEGRAHELGQQL